MAKVTPRVFTALCVVGVFAIGLFIWPRVQLLSRSVSYLRSSVNWTAPSDLQNTSHSGGGGFSTLVPSSNNRSGEVAPNNGSKTKDGPGSSIPPRTLPKQPDKFLIYACVTTDGLCGGWGDRQEGLVTVFLLANLTNRRFGIRMNTPCDLQKFVLPNEYNWIIPDKDIEGKRTRHIHAIDKCDFSRAMPTLDFNAKYSEDVVFLHTNRDLYADIKDNPHYRDILPPWARQPRPEFFRHVWRTLMKPSPHMQQRLENFLLSVHYFNRTRPLLGVHVRTGASAHFTDASFADRITHLGVLWDFVQPYVANGSDLFVATDNPEVRSMSLTKFGTHHHDTEVVLRHIDRQRSDQAVCQSFEGAILDQLILMRCDVLVVSPGSGFSSRAAMVRGSNKNLFNYGSKSVTPADMYKMCEPIC